MDLRQQCSTLRRIARLLASPLFTVARTLKAMGLELLKDLLPPVPVRRYQWDQCCDIIHVDIKHLDRFYRVGHRIPRDRRLGRSSGAGHEKAHVAIDDATRLANAEVLPDEKQATTVEFLNRALAWLGSQGITCHSVLMSNGSAYPSRPCRQFC